MLNRLNTQKTILKCCTISYWMCFLKKDRLEILKPIYVYTRVEHRSKYVVGKVVSCWRNCN